MSDSLLSALARALIISLAVAARAAAQPSAAPESAELRASRVIGMEVLDLAGDEIGEVHDLVVELDTGRLRYALVGTPRLALPFSALTLGLYEDVFVADLERAPAEGAGPLRPGLARASELLEDRRILDLVIDVEAGEVTEAVLRHAIVPFVGLVRPPAAGLSPR